MTLLTSSILAIIGGLSLSLACLSLAGFLFTTGLLIAGHHTEDVKMVCESSLFLFIVFLGVSVLT